MFSRDGRYLYGSSYYTGVSNIFRYEVATGAIEAVSNAEIGLLSPGTACRRTTAGAELHERRVRSGDHRAAPVARRQCDQIPGRRGRREVSPSSRPGRLRAPAPSTTRSSSPARARGFRCATGARERVPGAAGLQELRRDRLSRQHRGFPRVREIRNDRRLHADRQPARRSARPRRNDRGIPGLAGRTVLEPFGFLRPFRPHQAQPQGLCGQAGLRRPPHLRRAATVRGEIRPRVLRQDRHAAERAERRNDVHPTSHRRRSGSTTPMCGARSARSTTRRGSPGRWWPREARRKDEITPQICGTLDIGFPLPLPHSSIWLRSAAGGANGDRNNSLANFYFGGFGNNYVDSGPIQRYREYNSLPGFEIDEVSGKNFVREMVEWNLPPIVFESVGTPSFHLTWLRPAIFATALWTDVDEPVASTGLCERRHADRPQIQRAALVRHDALGGLCARLPERQARG